MTLARPENARDRFQLVSKPRNESAASEERSSDVWPDWSIEPDAAALAKVVKKNRPSVVLLEAVGAIAYSVGLVILLIIVLGGVHVR